MISIAINTGVLQAQLNTNASYHCYIFLAGLGLEVEEVFEKIKMGFDPQESFAQMDENRNVKDGVWGQVMRLNPPVKKKVTEEIRCWNFKSAFNKISKENYLIRFLERTSVT